MIQKWWPEQRTQAQKAAQIARKLLVQGYNQAMDCDYFAAMTREEYDTEKNLCRANPHRGWISIQEDYTATATAEFAYAFQYL